ncbi:MAG: TIGR04086 family membrane protein [Clostridia bacterium]|nr:TIGR04086 family membrane protein [Clostridia bacterium]
MEPYSRKSSVFGPQIARRSASGMPLIVFEFVVTFLAVLVLAVIYKLAPLPLGAVRSTMFVVSIAVMFAASFLAGRKAHSGGWLAGAVVTGIYGMVMVVLGWLTGASPILSVKWILTLITALLIGAMGGIVGLNTKPKRRRRY